MDTKKLSTEAKRSIQIRILVDAPSDFELFNPHVHDGIAKRAEAVEIVREAIAADEFTLEVEEISKEF